MRDPTAATGPDGGSCPGPLGLLGRGEITLNILANYPVGVAVVCQHLLREEPLCFVKSSTLKVACCVLEHEQDSLHSNWSSAAEMSDAWGDVELWLKIFDKKHGGNVEVSLFVLNKIKYYLGAA